MRPQTLRSSDSNLSRNLAQQPQVSLARLWHTHASVWQALNKRFRLITQLFSTEQCVGRQAEQKSESVATHGAPHLRASKGSATVVPNAYVRLEIVGTWLLSPMIMTGRYPHYKRLGSRLTHAFEEFCVGSSCHTVF